MSASNSHNGALQFAVRIPVIVKCFGQLALAISFLTFVPSLVAFLTDEYIFAFRLSIIALIFLCIGLATHKMSWPSRLQINETMAVVSLTLLITPLAMTWPLMASNLNFVDAFFEAVSAVTTTGLTTLGTIEDKSDAFLFTRAWMQWYSGLGFVILVLAFVINPNAIAKRLAIGETETQNFAGGNRTHFQRVLLVYVAITAIGIITLLICGVNFRDAILYIFAAVSTAGYSPYDTSLAVLPASAALITILICFIGALPLFLLYSLFRGKVYSIFFDLQVQAFFVVSIALTMCVLLSLYFIEQYSFNAALYHGAITTVSAQSTAGFSSLSIASLEPFTKAILIFSMFVGGCVGSTAGGVKVLRTLVFYSVLKTFLQKTSMPSNIVIEPRLKGAVISKNELRGALILIVLLAITIFLSWLAFLAYRYDPLDSLFEVISAICTVGLSSGITNPELPSFLKFVLCLNMLLGRLEIIAWIVLFLPATWMGRRRRYTEQ